MQEARDEATRALAETQEAMDEEGELDDEDEEEELL